MQNVSFPFSQYKTATELTEYTFSQPEVRSTYKRYKASDFALKILGREEYLMDVVPFIQYKVCVCVYLHVHVCVCLCLCLSICASVSVCVMCLYLSMCLCLSVCVSVSICMYMSVSICMYMSVSFYVCVCLICM